MFIINSIRRFSTKAMVASLLIPGAVGAHKHISPHQFVYEQCPKILTELGANQSLIKINHVVDDKMTKILESTMVQGMAKGTLSKDEWNQKYMKPDVLYIYNLGQSLATRVTKEEDRHKPVVKEIADMFLGYQKHFEKLKKYGLSPEDALISPECDEHISFLAKDTSINEFYVAILTDMIPYVVFSNYLLKSIEPADNNPWIEYAEKYGNLENKYAKDRLAKIIQIANRLLENKEVSEKVAQRLFVKGFTFEEWFIRHCFTEGFTIAAKPEMEIPS